MPSCMDRVGLSYTNARYDAKKGRDVRLYFCLSYVLIGIYLHLHMVNIIPGREVEGF